MKREKKNSVTPTSHHSLDPDAEKELKDFADLLIDSMKQEYKNELEPFEVYAQKLRSQIHANVNEFQARIAHGYDILLQELNHQAYHRDH